MIRFGQLIILFAIIISSCSSSRSDQSPEWTVLSTQFEEGYQQLNLGGLNIGYVQNLESIKSLDSILLQEQFFKSIEQSLADIDTMGLSVEDRLDVEIVQYQTALNLERIGLEKEWSAARVDSIPTNGLSSVLNGKNWYAYFLRAWVDLAVTPDEIFDFGLSEIERVKSRMKALQERSGMNSMAFLQHIQQDSFFYTDVDAIQAAFEVTKKRVAKNLADYFPSVDQVPDVKIARGTNEALAQVPAFYNGAAGTFYYNYFDTPFNKRQIAWVYIHEAMPGHHYQMNLDEITPQSPIQLMFGNYGYIEGYAAYIEEIGYEIGAYQNIYDELGKWEWDIIRSVRVALDVGLNYYDWSDEKALAFWQQHIQEKDQIALREIARMKRWPAQVVTYKYGADKFLKWKAIDQNKDGFKLKEFHAEILKYGPLPFSILERRLVLRE